MSTSNGPKSWNETITFYSASVLSYHGSGRRCPFLFLLFCPFCTLCRCGRKRGAVMGLSLRVGLWFVWLSLWFLCQRPSIKIPMTKFPQSAPWCQLRKGPRTTASQPQHMNKVRSVCVHVCVLAQFPCLSLPFWILAVLKSRTWSSKGKGHLRQGVCSSHHTTWHRQHRRWSIQILRPSSCCETARFCRSHWSDRLFDPTLRSDVLASPPTVVGRCLIEPQARRQPNKPLCIERWVCCGNSGTCCRSSNILFYIMWQRHPWKKKRRRSSLQSCMHKFF